MKKQSIIIAFFASIVQFYDYALFGLAASVLAKAYMPNYTESSKLLGFFAVLSTATLMRPFGSLLFGYLGDRYGRAYVLKSACLLAALSTLTIGLIPAEGTAFSACFMMLCRMAFMMSQSGEGDGVRIYVAETIGRSREFLGNGLVTCSGQVGALLAAVCSWLAFGEEMLGHWWRLPFIAGGVAGLIVFALRVRIQESDEFLRLKRGSKEARIAIQEASRNEIGIFFLATIISGAIGGIYHFYVIFFGAYVAKMTGIIAQEYVSVIPTLVIMLYIILSPLSGYLADRFNAKYQVICSVGILVVLSIFQGCFLGEGGFELWLFLCTAAMMPFFSVPLQIILKRMMPIGSRMRNFSLSHSIGSMIFSSSVPFVCSWMWYATGIIWLPILYVVAMGIILLACVIFLSRT